MTRRLWIIVACVLAIATWNGVQWVRSAFAVRDVQVRVVEADCPGQHMDWAADSATVETTRQMRCKFKVLVSNDSGRPVQIDTVTAPFLGPRTGSVVRAESVAGQSPHGRVDAVVQMNKDVWPHGAAMVSIIAVFNPRGCNDSGTVSFDRWPEVTVSSFGHQHTAHADFDLSFHNTIRTPGCRALEGQQ